MSREGALCGRPQSQNPRSLLQGLSPLSLLVPWSLASQILATCPREHSQGRLAVLQLGEGEAGSMSQTRQPNPFSSRDSPGGAGRSVEEDSYHRQDRGRVLNFSLWWQPFGEENGLRSQALSSHLQALVGATALQKALLCPLGQKSLLK